MAAQDGLRRGFGRMVSDSFAGIAPSRRRVQGADDLGGGRQLALIARELVQGPFVVMLDEPTASLASTTGQADARNSSPGDVGVLVKFTTHDPRPTTRTRRPVSRTRHLGCRDASVPTGVGGARTGRLPVRPGAGGPRIRQAGIGATGSPPGLGARSLQGMG